MGKFINCRAAVREMLLSSGHVDVEDTVREAAAVLEQPPVVATDTLDTRYATDYPVAEDSEQPVDNTVVSPQAEQFGIEDEGDKTPQV
jgi:hypothetical protein